VSGLVCRCVARRQASVLADLDKWVRRRLRCVHWKQWRSSRNRHRELRRRGVDGLLAAHTAGSACRYRRISKSPALSYALPNAYFSELGLPQLHKRTGSSFPRGCSSSALLSLRLRSGQALRLPGSSCQGQRTKYKGQSNGEGEREMAKSGHSSFPLCSCPLSRGVLTLGFWSPVIEARSHKPQAAGRELGLRA